VRLQGVPEIAFDQVQERKDKLVAQLRSGMEFMLKGIEYHTSRCVLRARKSISAARKSNNG